MPAGEYQDWVKYYNVEPFGFPRANQMFGELMMAVLAASPKPFKREVLSPKHWMYQSTVSAPMDVEAMIESIKSTFPTRSRSIRRRPRKKQEPS